ncbi:UPF0691 protein C9orf116 homolog isoform X1 [Lingula anatina]|uniref:UPF0691 protein C9orf116 homolog isoform X1 n=1 Tax=Lingula anatina TaxID=7574 RepID=A0A1S3HTN0_LINAN|nr:UPF0691 protein C9orf116 homolog isoform X1 [Lingula anatina]|eukprot:XP_013388414.1 UPF0691 protein C9orf116 homolog isoform X1 [Lingula anatina]
MASNQVTQNSQVAAVEEVVDFAPGGVPKEPYNLGNPVYTCRNNYQMPQPREDECFQGYGKREHPLYRTTANNYGMQPPSVHTMPTTFHCKSQKFSEHLGICGMYRDQGLNTSTDKSKV